MSLEQTSKWASHRRVKCQKNARRDIIKPGTMFYLSSDLGEGIRPPGFFVQLLLEIQDLCYRFLTLRIKGRAGRRGQEEKEISAGDVSRTT
jgi:hypothetical protein